MKINELSKELNITNKDLISYLRSMDFKVSSHMQNATDEMVDAAREEFKIVAEKVDEKNVLNKEGIRSNTSEKEKNTEVTQKKFLPDDMIVCRSVTPWQLIYPSLDGHNYVWNGYNDIEYVTYRDLQVFRSKEILRKAKIIIEDPDLCYQWRRDLGEAYKIYLTVEYPEEFFDLSDEKFKKLLTNAPFHFKEVIKYTAQNMVKNENYPTVQKLNIVDEILGTCIKDFL